MRNTFCTNKKHSALSCTYIHNYYNYITNRTQYNAHCLHKCLCMHVNNTTASYCVTLHRHYRLLMTMTMCIYKKTDRLAVKVIRHQS